VAWTQKLCYYANSSGCSEDDPEFTRVAKAFTDSSFDFHTLVVELFSRRRWSRAKPPRRRAAIWERRSPSRGKITCARRSPIVCSCPTSLCVGISDKTTQTAVANNIPLDGYLRGAEAPALSTAQTPFYRGAAEALCSYAAGLTIDKLPMSRYSSAKKTPPSPDFVANIMASRRKIRTAPR